MNKFEDIIPESAKMNSIRYNFRLDPELSSDLEKYSKEAKISASRFIRRAIRQAIKTNQKS
ncbi:MAG TPA: hypothetical protein ENH82_05405 [bacterium]|nr:hypothetical protein [bacterium]